MAVSIGSLIMDLRASTTGLRKDAAKAVKEGRKLGNQFAKGVAAGAAVAAGLAVKEFAGFQKAFAEVRTITSGTAKEMRMLEMQTTALAGKLGTDLTESAQGLYQTISAGIPKENAIAFLETASKGAVAGVTDIKTSVDGLSTVINAFKIDAANVGEVSDVMFTTVRNGKTTFEELSSSIADVAPLAASMNVNFKEVFAATATLTKQGTKTSVAMTQIRASLVALTKPTAEMEELFKRLNVETGQQLLDQYGLAGSLQKLNSVASKPELAKAMGRIEGLNALLGLSGENAKMFAKDLADMQNSAGATDVAFEEMQNTLSAFLKNIKSIVLSTIFPLMAEAYDSLVQSAGGTQELLLNVKETVMDLVTVAVKGFGYIGNAMRGWELIIKTGRVAFAGLFELILVNARNTFFIIHKLDAAIAAMVNTVIDGINSLADLMPGVSGDIERISTELSDSIMQNLDNLVAGARNARETLTDEMLQVFDKPLPSDTVDTWLKEVKQKANEAAFSVGATVQQMRSGFQAPIIPEEVAEDTKEKVSDMGRTVTTEFVNPVQTAFESTNDQISGLVRGTQSINDALLDVSQTVVTSVIQSFLQMGMQMLTQQATMAMGLKSIQTSAMAASASAAATAGGTALASWAPAAMAASIATLGGAAGAGISAYTLALAGGMAATVGIGALGNLAMNAVNLGTGKKRGGSVNPGTTYPVHEEGLPEFFRPDVSGKVIPLSDMDSGLEMNSGGGMSIQVTQNFYPGITRADLDNEAKKIKKETIQGVAEAVSRGGQYRRKMNS